MGYQYFRLAVIRMQSILCLLLVGGRDGITGHEHEDDSSLNASVSQSIEVSWCKSITVLSSACFSSESSVSDCDPIVSST